MKPFCLLLTFSLTSLFGQTSGWTGWSGVIFGGGVGGGGSGTPGGANTSVQINDSGAFYGDATNFFYNKTTHLLTASGGFDTGAGSVMTGSTDGYFSMTNRAGTGFTGLQFGGTTASFPMWKRSGTGLVARLADDSANADITVNSCTGCGGSSGGSILSGTYAARPACSTTNYLYKFTTGLLDSAVCDGASTLTYLYNGYSITPAAALSGLANNVLQTGVTTSNTNGFETMSFGASGTTSQSTRKWTAPGGTWTKTIVVYFTPSLNVSSPQQTISVGVGDSAGKIQVINCGTSTNVVGGFWCGVFHADATGAWVANDLADVAWGNGPNGGQGKLTFTIQLTSTNLVFGVSGDGTNSTTMLSIAKGSYLADQSYLVYGGNNSAPTTWAVSLLGAY